jgi:hypothetical protein
MNEVQIDQGETYPAESRQVVLPPPLDRVGTRGRSSGIQGGPLRTKVCLGLRSVDIDRLSPHPEVIATWDGLVGLDARPKLVEVLRWLQERKRSEHEALLAGLRTARFGELFVSFEDHAGFSTADDGPVVIRDFGTRLLLYYRQREKPHGTQFSPDPGDCVRVVRWRSHLPANGTELEEVAYLAQGEGGGR